MTRRVDPVRLEIFKSLFHSVAEEMGAGLRRSAFSPNITERRDYSCAVFDARRNVLAMGDHMPVHLGSMPASVVAATGAFDLEPGDAVLLNDPYAGGTHLPDLTLVMPVFAADGLTVKRGRASVKRAENRAEVREGVKTLPYKGGIGPLFYVANRAHHADVGGAQAGSMGLSREIFQEGLRIPPVKILQRGRLNRDVVNMLLANVRTPKEREGDLTAQIAACRIGERRLLAMVTKYGWKELSYYAGELLNYSDATMRAVIRGLPDGTYRAEDFLDDDGISDEPLRIAVKIRVRGGRVVVDFSGSSPECAGSVNAVRAIAESAVFYVFRCLLNEQIPATSGLMRAIDVVTPEGSIVNARPPRAVAGGNVETSQRIVDALLKALSRAAPSKIPAASQGTMNNLTFGGADTRPGRTGQPFAYYETIAGGMGARPGMDGVSGIHTHMTNSLNTPVEVLEHTLPVRVREYSLRGDSGGKGEFRGGDGVVREFEALTEMDIGMLSDRRKFGPYGLAGGSAGKPGRAKIKSGPHMQQILAKGAWRLKKGSILRVETPGGGGWGKFKSRRAKTK
jgi:N-methylhydantoinase B